MARTAGLRRSELAMAQHGIPPRWLCLDGVAVNDVD